MAEFVFDYTPLYEALRSDKVLTRPSPARNHMNCESRARYRKVLLAVHGRYCWLCDKPIVDETPTLDHIVPRSKGGRNAICNLRLAHFRCNQERGDGPVPELLLTRLAEPLARIEAAWPLPRRGERCEAREPETASN